MVKCFYTNNNSQTKKIAKNLAKKILAKNFYQQKEIKKAFLIGLEGSLGSGKTTFLQGFAQGLGIKEKILSPTFVIMKKFKIKDLRFKNFYHIDCYRISKPKEILDLGWRKIISDPKNIVAVEWADRISKILPKETLILKFEFISKNKRKILFESDFGKIRENNSQNLPKNILLKNLKQ